jgi:1-phosphofructokinase family hexose kinase
MFLCVSLNPAIDKRLTMGRLQRGKVNRARSAESYAGGKAAHVAMVLKTLGEKPHWIGPCGGASGEALVEGLSAWGIEAAGCATKQATRTNLELIEEDGAVTEILEPGLSPSASEWAEFQEVCKERFVRGAEQLSVIFSGSVPQGADPGLYAQLIGMAEKAGCRTFLDTSGEALRLGLAAKPFFVKPNLEEVSQLLGMPVTSLSTGVRAIRGLLDWGAQSAAVSLGADGLLFCAGVDTPVLFAPVLPVKIRSTVGCGDSALAGFAKGMASNFSPEETLQLAAACAAANCLADSPGAARAEDIKSFQGQVVVQTPAVNP